MAPPSVQVIINSTTYAIPILNGEMENLTREMEDNKLEMERSRQRYNNAKTGYDDNCKQLLLIYIQQTGEYPS